MQKPENAVKQFYKLVTHQHRQTLNDLHDLREGIYPSLKTMNDNSAANHKETRMMLYVGFGVLSAALFARAGADMYAAHEYAKEHQIITIHDQPGCDANPDEPKGMSYKAPSAKPFSPKI